MADAIDDDSEGSRGKRLDGGGNGSGNESEGESSSAAAPPPPEETAATSSGGGGDAFLDAVKGVSDEATAVVAPAPAPAEEETFDQYAPAPPSASSSSSSAAAAAAAAAAAPPKPPHSHPPAPAPARSSSSLSRRGSVAVPADGGIAESSEDVAAKAEAAAAAAAAAAAKHAADAERRKELVAQLEQLSETLKLYEREHDFFYTGLAGFGVLIGLVVFVSTWLAGLSGSLSLGTESRSRTLQIVIAAAGIVGGLFSTAQRVWSPAVRSQYYKNARDDYARLRKKCKAALGGNNDGGGEASLAALESAVRSISAKADDLYERSPDIPVDADGFLVEHGRLSYSILLGFGAAFYPCAACCSPAGPKKPADGRSGGRDDLV